MFSRRSFCAKLSGLAAVPVIAKFLPVKKPASDPWQDLLALAYQINQERGPIREIDFFTDRETADLVKKAYVRSCYYEQRHLERKAQREARRG